MPYRNVKIPFLKNTLKTQTTQKAFNNVNTFLTVKFWTLFDPQTWGAVLKGLKKKKKNSYGPPWEAKSVHSEGEFLGSDPVGDKNRTCVKGSLNEMAHTRVATSNGSAGSTCCSLP